MTKQPASQPVVAFHSRALLFLAVHVPCMALPAAENSSTKHTSWEELLTLMRDPGPGEHAGHPVKSLLRLVPDPALAKSCSPHQFKSPSVPLLLPCPTVISPDSIQIWF
ncbi:hypothetical protein H920_17256 [Fukomys damarensis]|uniref:Uncharacterized protein n=1 Tax=Fukomys damarensis TaxID=885580 RepID=A0A091CSQ0_FUKDA|nr:hypothetical protein H920_17256 [Fukomys damarensis]